MAKPVPDGFHTVTPYLIVDDAGKLIEFLKSAFAASVHYAHKGPDGKIGHAEVKVGDSILMMGTAPGETKPTAVNLYMYVPDCDALYNSALAAGAVSISEPKNQFYGDRHGGVKDPCGNTWWIGTHIEDVSEEEMTRRMAAAKAQA